MSGIAAGLRGYGDAIVNTIVDTVAVALTREMTLSDLVDVDVCYSPPYV